MKEILEYLVKNLVKNADTVSITSELDDKVTVYTVRVDKEDMGGLIGKKGNTAQAIRTIMRAYTKPSERIAIKFEENV